VNRADTYTTARVTDKVEIALECALAGGARENAMYFGGECECDK
jgi:hypothetical protein